ncbi:MAG: biopolymer transporter ExbD [Acidiferrobacterales bacterium]
MARRKHYGRDKEPPELNITSFMNLMVVLVPFLLISAVFSQVTILQLNLPSVAALSEADKKKIRIEVVVRENRIEIGDGRRLIKRIRNTNKGYNVKEMSKVLMAIKKRYPGKRDAIILLEPDIQYAVLVKLMDAIGTAEVIQGLDVQRIELFPQISIGDAPSSKRRKR